MECSEDDGRETYQFDGASPLINCEVDFADKVMEMPYQTGHNLGQAVVGIGASGVNDLVGQESVYGMAVCAWSMLGYEYTSRNELGETFG